MSRVLLDGGAHSLQEVVGRLKFIGGIRAGDRVDTAALAVVPDTYYRRAVRALRELWYAHESRDTTLEFARRTVAEAYAMLEEGGRTPDESRMLVEGVVGVRAGLAALRETYADDRMFVARLDAFRELIPDTPEALKTRKNR